MVLVQTLQVMPFYKDDTQIQLHHTIQKEELILILLFILFLKVHLLKYLDIYEKYCFKTPKTTYLKYF